MVDETIHQFIHRRERELTSRIAALEGQLALLTAELVQIKKMATAVTIAGQALNIGSDDPALAPVGGMDTPIVLREAERFAGMSIKELILEALRVRGPSRQTELRHFLRDGFHRDIGADSLRPQLSRLKSEGVIEQNPLYAQWRLSEAEVRRQQHLETRQRTLSALFDEAEDKKK